MNKKITEQENNSKKKRRARIWYSLLILIFILAFYFVKIADNYPLKQDLNFPPRFFGVTFSDKFCAELGLDRKESRFIGTKLSRKEGCLIFLVLIT